MQRVACTERNELPPDAVVMGRVLNSAGEYNKNNRFSEWYMQWHGSTFGPASIWNCQELRGWWYVGFGQYGNTCSPHARNSPYC